MWRGSGADPRRSRTKSRWRVADGLWDLYFWVDDVDALHRGFVGRGATIDSGLCDQPHGCRAFGTPDIDGRDIGFGQAMNAANPS